MGTTQSTNSNKFLNKLSTKYDFIISTKDDHLGPIKIYRKRQPFYDYLMVVQKIISVQSLPIYQSQLQAIYSRNNQTDQQSMLLKLYAHQLPSSFLSNNKIIGTQCQSTTIKMKLYVEYYNFTLKQLIEHRNQHKKRQKMGALQLEQIMYVLWNVVKIYRFFQSIQAMNIQFHSSQIFVTPEGQIRFSPIQIFQSQMVNNMNKNNNKNRIINTVQCIESIDCFQPRKFSRTFQMRQKLIVYEIKKLLNQMTMFNNDNRNNGNKNNDNKNVLSKQSQQLYLLKNYMNNVSSINEIQKLLYQPVIDRIAIGGVDNVYKNNKNTQRQLTTETNNNNNKIVITNTYSDYQTATNTNNNNQYNNKSQQIPSPIFTNQSQISSLKASKISVKNYFKDNTSYNNHYLKNRPLSQQPYNNINKKFNKLTINNNNFKN